MRSVIVRLFEPAAGTGGVGLCGLVEDVRTGASWRFQDGEQLLDVLARAAGTALPAASPGLAGLTDGPAPDPSGRRR